MSSHDLSILKTAILYLLIFVIVSTMTQGLNLNLAQQREATAPTLNNQDLMFCSFNIQVFGKTKMSKQHVVNILLKILSECHITFIMEIRDSTGTAIVDLLNQLNRFTNHTRSYQLQVSERLGRTSSKEQYAFIYDSKMAQITSTYQFPVHFDFFERPPFSVIISSTLSHQQLFITGIHTSPKLAVQEIDHLFDVYQFYLSQHNTSKLVQTNWLVTGDFNAGCSYVTPSDWQHIRLRTDKSFDWLITDNMDTMVKTNCPYDRFVMPKARVLNITSYEVFYYSHEWKLDQSLAIEVSDHFPIRLLVKNWNHH
ncbi:hypothetical protein C9374_007042 [Naegleria lovaniensis]|uniref:Deoxyribonuclease n=1 Tax=Naegleria lovaniensis TaxID=51637 RepID=A0AA88H482_NAELO|nr:uncharacterized protein C9374_007042 [Naegleria lovaniensis]KAG2393511.1 hypothetical protein C9374_007042 [Naegleria lovaniensis]